MLLPATCECSGWRKTYHKPSVLWQFRSKNRVAGETGVNSWGKTHLGNMINQWFFRYQIFRHTHSLKPCLWGWYVFWKTRSAGHVHVSRGSLYIPLHQDENIEPLLVKNWWFSGVEFWCYDMLWSLTSVVLISMFWCFWCKFFGDPSL